MSSNMQREAAFDRIVDYRVEVRNLTALKLKKCRLNAAKLMTPVKRKRPMCTTTHKARCFAVRYLTLEREQAGDI